MTAQQVSRWGRTAPPARPRSGSPARPAAAGELGERRRTADEGGRAAGHQRAELGRGQPPGRPVGVVGSRDSAIDRTGGGQFLRERQVGQRAGRHGQLQQVRPADRGGVPHHGHQRDRSAAAADPHRRRSLPSQTNQPPIGPRTSRASPACTTSARKVDTSPSSSRSTQSSTSGSDGADATEYDRAARVAVVGGQPHHVVLTRQVVDPVLHVQPEHHRAGRRMRDLDHLARRPPADRSGAAGGGR